MTIWNALTVDVEDWFHIMEIEGGPPLKQWASLENRVEKNTMAFLDFLDSMRTVGTFFALGWIAERYPFLIERILERGHEIGSHGYAHVPAFRQTREEFRLDLAKSVAVIEGITGSKPAGYRIPGFSLVPKTSWALEAIHGMGFLYDSSLVPGFRFHGGWIGSPRLPHRISFGNGQEIAEFPISTLGIGNRRIPFLGGGYLRIFPLSVSVQGLNFLNARGIPGLMYVHPRDIDPTQPRLEMPPFRRFASYTGLNSCLPKLRFLLKKFRFTTVTNALEGYFSSFSSSVWQPTKTKV